jgi:adenylate cyclase
MTIKTENLAILLTDIAGFSETTVQQSRQENARLLASHNRILLPIIRRYKGRHVKSIGDALLLVFRSPTDAMLCAMAMQDALFEYNRNTPGDQQIHIRVAASLGEVRVTRNDVFGEAVNITSRIEGITPADEIYMSEAVYMAMNKAEVPSHEVGWRELKGLSAPIRIFNIPRFSTPRLVPQDVMAAEDMSDLVYPYGGAHLAAAGAEGRLLPGLGVNGLATGRVARWVAAALVLVPTAILAVYYGPALLSARTGAKPVLATKEISVPVATASRAPAARAYQPEFTAHADPKPARRPANASGAAAKAAPTDRYQPEFSLSKSDATPDSAGSLSYARISDAKRAYKDKKISKDQYKKIVNSLESAMEQEIQQVKVDYKANKISKQEYRDRIDRIETQYK